MKIDQSLTQKTLGHVMAGVLVNSIRALGSLIGGLVSITLVLSLVYFGFINALSSFALGLIIGVSIGVVALLNFIDYIVTHEPEAFVKEYRKWKADGRWLK